MKIVLLRSVDNLGQAGEQVEVKRGYFRNFLEPRGMALTASPSNLRLVEAKRKKLEALVAREKSSAEKIREQLDGQKITFHLRAGDRGQVFGSVTSRDVVDAIKESFNIEIERRRVDMENLKALGDHPVRIRVYPGVVATITAAVERLVTAEEAADGSEEQLPGMEPLGMGFFDDEDERDDEFEPATVEAEEAPAATAEEQADPET